MPDNEPTNHYLKCYFDQKNKCYTNNDNNCCGGPRQDWDKPLVKPWEKPWDKPWDEPLVKPKVVKPCRKIIDDNPPQSYVPNYLRIYCAPLKLDTTSQYNINSSSTVLTYDSGSDVKYNFHNDVDVDKKTFFSTNQIDILMNGTNFRLDEFHIHNLAENIIDNCRQEAEIHFVFEEVHENIDNHHDVNYAVIAFILKEYATSDTLITNILQGNPFNIPDISEYFTFSGALTKPNVMDVPQTAVAWNISTTYLDVSASDLKLLRERYSRNSAEVQPSNSRNICLIQLGESPA